MKFWYRINDGAMQERETVSEITDTETAARSVLLSFNSDLPKYTSLAPWCTISIYFDKESHVSGRHGVAELFGYIPKSEPEYAVASSLYGWIHSDESVSDINETEEVTIDFFKNDV